MRSDKRTPFLENVPQNIRFLIDHISDAQLDATDCVSANPLETKLAAEERACRRYNCLEVAARARELSTSTVDARSAVESSMFETLGRKRESSEFPADEIAGHYGA